VTDGLQLSLVPTLAATVGKWRAVYWEPVMATGERLCFAILTEWQGRRAATGVLSADHLAAMYGASGPKAAALLERAVRLLDASLKEASIEQVSPPFSGVFLGPAEVAHSNDLAGVLQVAKIMSSSLATLSDPDTADMADEAVETRQPVKHFQTRVRHLVIARRPDLANCFAKEASLSGARRPVKFGFLSTDLVAHFGLLPTTAIRAHVRTARGLFAELSMAHKQSGIKATLILGHPPLESATLGNNERSALRDYLQDLTAEALQFGVELAAADNDNAARDALLLAL